MSKTQTFGVLALPILVLSLAGCTEEIDSEPAAESSGLSRVALAASPEATPAVNRYRTHLYSELDADVYARLGRDDSGDRALVEEIHVEIGDRVRAGQVLATLEDDEARLAVQAARAEAEEARADFARMEELLEKEVATQAQHDESRSVKERAEAALARAELELSRTRVRAPFSGVVSRRYIRVGELVQDGSPLFRVTAMAPLRARLLVPENRVAAFRSGSPVELTDLSGRATRARVLLVGPTVDPGSGTREVLIEIDEPDGLRPGATVTAEPLAGTEEGSE